jgi:hypothetical protein
VSETGEKFIKPGFVHKKPAPTAVNKNTRIIYELNYFFLETRSLF